MLSRQSEQLSKSLFILALVFLLTACQGSAGTISPTQLPASTSTPLAAATSTVAPTNTVAPTIQSVPTAQPATPTVVPAASTMRLVVQLPDNSVQLVDTSGNKTPLAKLDGQVDLASILPTEDESQSALYLPVTGMTPGVLRVDASGAQKLDWIEGPLNGIAANSSQLAWGMTDIRATMMAARIQISKLDGSDVRTGLEEIYSGEQKSLHVVRWSREGGKLYFSKEPLGIGGYILFAGLTNLWSLDVSSGKATEVLHEIAPNAAVCMDDLSPDETQIAQHCQLNSMEVINLTTKAIRTINPPADVPQFGVVGGARFSPDGSRLAYALARRDPGNEQGWVAVSEGTSGTSRLIATSPAQDYFWVAAWLDSDTIILQSGMPPQGIWSVRADGSNLKQLADGIFLGMIGDTAQDCGQVQMRGPNPPTEAAAQQAENCIWSAYQKKSNARLIVSIMGVDTVETHTITIANKSGQAAITDVVEHTIVPARVMPSQTYTCTALVQQQQGLLFKSCGDEGDFSVPAPAS